VVAGEWDAAIAVLERSQLPASIVRGERAYALAHSGRRDEARQVVREMQESGDGAQSIAAVYAALGETEEALTRLEAAVTADPGALRSLPADPRFAELRGRQRFAELLRHLGRALGRSSADTART
jgi:tetratricopeptide (TPR) repeat protein